MSEEWYVLELNAEPWALGPLSVGRKNGGVFPMIGQNSQLKAFQEAVKEVLGIRAYKEGPLKLTFYFWRDRAEYTTPNQRQHRKHQADATNLQKATEDALQGVLFENDKDVQDVRTVIVEQGPGVMPRIIVKIEPYMGLDPNEIPAHVWDIVEEQTNRKVSVDISRQEGEDLF